jgi:hypothetical protein
MPIEIIEEATWVEQDGRRQKVPAIGRCQCGRKVVLANFTNPCDCGRDYNWNGSLLAPRHHWGEETGEHWADIY